MFEKILVATDFSDSSRSAWFAAINLAGRCLARIEVVNVYTYMAYVFSPERYAVPDETWHKRLVDELETRYPTRLYPNSNRRIVNSPSIPDGILDHAKNEGCDLIVVGTHGRKALGRILMGSVTSELIRNSSVPVMVVKNVKSSEEHVQNYQRILVPIDFSDMSMKALDYGIRIANFFQADLHLIHVVDVPTLGSFTTMYPVPETVISSATDWNVDLTLAKAIEDKEIVGSTRVSTLFGDPAEEILNYAKKENCGFIVMGTHGRRGFEKVLLGSVTTSVASKSEIPVITVSPMKYQH
jgi:nucleotide-binding universal stress UspA family protein